MLILFFPIGIYLMFKYKHFNNIVKIIITIFFALFAITSFSDTDSNIQSTQKVEITQNQNQNQNKIEIDNKKLLTQIKVSAEIQDIFNEGKQKVVFNVKMNPITHLMEIFLLN